MKVKKFNPNDYKGKYAMHCKTEKEARDFCNYLHSIGKKWGSGDSYKEKILYHNYGNDTAYNFNDGTYCSILDYRRWGFTILEWEDFMNNEFTKTDLKTGDVVKFSNGEVGLIINDIHHPVIVMKDTFAQLKSYNEDLTYKHIDELKRFDIVAVRRPIAPYHCQFCAFKNEYGNLVYERKEPEEMTLAEVCKLLGKEIKIVKG